MSRPWGKALRGPAQVGHSWVKEAEAMLISRKLALSVTGALDLAQ